MTQLAFMVPLVPPSVNHYKVPVKFRTRDGMRSSFAVTPEGVAFKTAVAVLARGRTIAPPAKPPSLRRNVRYRLHAQVYLGKGQRGDGDNFWKCIADGLVEAGVIHSDARVRDWVLCVHDTDRANPRTEIRAEVIEVAEEEERED